MNHGLSATTHEHSFSIYFGFQSRRACWQDDINLALIKLSLFSTTTPHQPAMAAANVAIQKPVSRYLNYFCIEINKLR